jgi:hypothetical protein
MSPEELIWLLLFLLLLLLILLWWLITRGFLQPPPTPPVGWLLEAWDRNNQWVDVCDGKVGKMLYPNLSGRAMRVNVEVVNAGDCPIEFSTAAQPTFIRVLPGARAAAAIALAHGDAITYNCCVDASGEHCRASIRIQKL